MQGEGWGTWAANGLEDVSEKAEGELVRPDAKRAVGLLGEKGWAPRLQPDTDVIQPAWSGKATASPKETLPQALKPQALSGFLRSDTFFSPPAFEGKKSTLPH